MVSNSMYFVCSYHFLQHACTIHYTASRYVIQNIRIDLLFVNKFQYLQVQYILTDAPNRDSSYRKFFVNINLHFDLSATSINKISGSFILQLVNSAITLQTDYCTSYIMMYTNRCLAIRSDEIPTVLITEQLMVPTIIRVFFNDDVYFAILLFHNVQ